MDRIKCYLRTGFLVTAVMMILMSIAIAQSEVPEGEKEAKAEQILILQVISKVTREPISDAELSIQIMQESREDKTDKDGRCRIVLGDKTPEYVRVEVRKEGFVPIRLAWRQTVSRPVMPDQYTLTLEQGTSIGGIIHDEQGNPVEGASVYLLVPGGDEIERAAIWDHTEKTDAEGHWRCDIIPSKLDDIWIRLAHPDYISDEMYGKTPKPPIEQLRAMTSVMVMKQGLTVSGRVIDANDRPIEGASVAQGSDRFGSHYPSTQTDSEGQFEFENSRPGEMVLTVQAKGYSPDLKNFTIYKGMEPLEFRLEHGHTIRGRIMDTAGNPISGAFVAADTWRGHRSLEWRVDTDAEGRFKWNEAPADEVLIDMGKQHYMSVRNYGMSPSEQEYEITMPPELKIRGKVVDAETGEPISEFKLLSGIDWGGDRPISWQRRNTKTFNQGQYEIGFSYPYPAHLIRIEAEGYKPGISRPIGSDEGEVTSDFKLEKGTGPTGIVHLPDGRPASGAEVILCTPSQGAYIHNGRNQQRRNSQYVETNEDGKFSFPVQTDVYAIVVLHDAGYLEAGESELSESSELTLQPWATVTGKVLIGKNPAANETVRLGFDKPYDRSAPRINHNYQAVTDSNGTFVLEHVPPGEARISRSIKISDRRSVDSHSMSLETKAGQTVSITIGGTGRPVTGKVQVPDYLKEKFDWQHTDYHLRINSSEGPYKQLGFKIEGDGTFRIDDVPTGDYQLSVNAYEPPADPRAFRGKRIGLLSQHFKVPEMPDSRSDEPLELGVLGLDVIGKSDFAPAIIGKPLPDLSDITIDFTPAQAKDKMILVCFFDMNQRPSRHCMIQIAKQTEQLINKGVTAIAVQASKMTQEALNQWVKKNNIPFPVGMVQGDAEKACFAWGVKSLPWLILTDSRHIVSSAGFGFNELDEKMKAAK
ncbi:MAG TPA: carboxypeptidase regulatory-like domain-containing protein [Sedimentisphaerales bacterium]|nr:carboxypeptidase regulatory-like domain-containing protein [Sedimentisphaerales bacterium]